MQNRIENNMFKQTCVAGALGFVCMAVSAIAQTNPPAGGTPITPPAGPPTIAERPTVVPPSTAPANADQPGRPARPGVPERPEPSKAVKDLVKDFQTARQDFIHQQQELNRQFKTANEEQRAAIRAQLKESLNTWLEEQKAHLQELREQAKDIKNNVPSIRDVIDSGGPEGRGR